ncbi:MAG: phycobilisome linker polypeptide [Pseudanabaena sp. RU_4_16]|nr:phycobilisome linker polypeptide [Pseudanabaena sp. RU_4_16]NKB16919.1 phycobilisome linker polypeptide [Pseudanabaena sp. CRU_2_10]
MLGKSPLMRASSSTSDNRMFVYEVEGLRQSDRTSNNSYQIRASNNVFIPVPYSRMNEEMQRITRIGGKIVNIRPLDASMLKSKAPAKTEATTKSQAEPEDK